MKKVLRAGYQGVVRKEGLGGLQRPEHNGARQVLDGFVLDPKREGYHGSVDLDVSRSVF